MDEGTLKTKLFPSSSWTKIRLSVNFSTLNFSRRSSCFVFLVFLISFNLYSFRLRSGVVLAGAEDDCSVFIDEDDVVLDVLLLFTIVFFSLFGVFLLLEAAALGVEGSAAAIPGIFFGSFKAEVLEAIAAFLEGFESAAEEADFFEAFGVVIVADEALEDSDFLGLAIA